MTTWYKKMEWAETVAKELPNICEDSLQLMAIPDGWRDIVYAALLKIENIAVTDGTDISISQIKEKFGGLRLYISSNCNEKVEDIVSKAEVSCWHTCAKCGNDGSIRTDIPWYQTLCDDHYLAEKKMIPTGGMSKDGSKTY